MEKWLHILKVTESYVTTDMAEERGIVKLKQSNSNVKFYQ